MSKENDVTREVEDHKARIRDLRAKLSELDKELNSKKGLRRSLGSEISLLIRKTKELRHERDLLTKEVKERKELRSKLNEDISLKVQKVRGVQEIKKQIEQSSGIKENPMSAKREIDRLNTKIETEGLSFEKEKELMKKIHTLEKKYAEMKECSKVWEEEQSLSDELHILQEKADSVHADIQKMARLSQEKHEFVVVQSQKIEQLQQKESEILSEIDKKQKLLDELRVGLETELQALSELTGVQEELNKQEQRLLREAEQKKLGAMRSAVEDKLRRGEKLTTNDLLILQSQGK